MTLDTVADLLFLALMLLVWGALPKVIRFSFVLSFFALHYFRNRHAQLDVEDEELVFEIADHLYGTSKKQLKPFHLVVVLCMWVFFPLDFFANRYGWNLQRFHGLCLAISKYVTGPLDAVLLHACFYRPVARRLIWRQSGSSRRGREKVLPLFP